jgi:hypothetical protein
LSSKTYWNKKPDPTPSTDALSGVGTTRLAIFSPSSPFAPLKPHVLSP